MDFLWRSCKRARADSTKHKSGSAGRMPAGQPARRRRYEDLVTELQSLRRPRPALSLPPRDFATRSCWLGMGGVAAVDEPSAGGAVVTLPTCSPASCTVWVTVPSGCPTKLGMTRAWGCEGAATSKLIFGAETPLAFGGGACARTWPSGASGNCICAMAPTSRPRRRMLMLATRSLWPMTIGDRDSLRAQALSDADLPASPYLASGGRELGQDFSFRHCGTVILALHA